MEPQLMMLRQAQLQDLLSLGWRPKDADSTECIVACYKELFDDVSVAANKSRSPGAASAQAMTVWSGIALMTYGKLEPLAEVLRVIQSHPSVVRSREAGSVVRAIQMLVPFPGSISPTQAPGAALEWLAQYGERLKWDESSGRYSITA